MFKDNASDRLRYRLRREHYAEMSKLAEAEGKEVEPPAVSRTLAQREQQIAKLTADNAALRDLALRARADLDNARKRFQREKADTIKFANEQLVRELLGVLDNLERAIVSVDGALDVKAVHDGVQMVFDQFAGILQGAGLEVVDPAGRPFDPHFHEAVSTEERDDVPEHTVVATFQKGYVLRGRVVRPAMVRVARAVQPAPAPPAEPAAEAAPVAEETPAEPEAAVEEAPEKDA